MLSFIRPDNTNICRPSTFVSNVNTLSYIAFGILVILSLILVQLFVLSRQLARNLGSPNPQLRLKRLPQRIRRRSRFYFRSSISNTLANDQSSAVTQSLLPPAPSPPQTSAEAIQCHVENFIAPSTHDNKPTPLRGTYERAIQCEVEESTRPSSHVQCDFGIGIPAPPTMSHTEAVQCNPVLSENPSFSASLSTNHSLSPDHSFPADRFSSADHSLSTDHSSWAPHSLSMNHCTTDHSSSPDHSSTSLISVLELDTLGITGNNRLGGLLACLQNGSDIYTIVHKKNPHKMTATLTIHPNDAIEITTLEGKRYTLIDASAKTFSLTSSIFATTDSSFSTKSLSDSTLPNPTPVPESITISQFHDLGLFDTYISNLLTVREDGTQDYSMTNPETKERIGILSIRTNHAIEVIKDGKTYMLTNASGKPVTLPPFSALSSYSEPLPQVLHSSSSFKRASSPPVKRPPSPRHRRCLWCDLLGHEIPECQDLVEDIRLGRIYISDDGIINASTDQRLYLAVGRGGMRSFL